MEEEKKTGAVFRRISVPDHVYATLKRQAEEQHRSLAKMLEEWVDREEKLLDKRNARKR